MGLERILQPRRSGSGGHQLICVELWGLSVIPVVGLASAGCCLGTSCGLGVLSSFGDVLVLCEPLAGGWGGMEDIKQVNGWACPCEIEN